MSDEENITTLPSGNHRVRVKYAGQVAAKTFAKDNIEGARRWRDAVKLEIADGNVEVVTGVSMKQLGPRFLASRSGNRDCKTDESRWHTHCAKASWALRPAIAATRVDGLSWLEELKGKETSYDPELHGERPTKTLAWDTRRKCLNLARRAFQWAIDKQLIPLTTNPFLGLVVEREDGDEDEGYQEGWYLDGIEQQWLWVLYDTATCLDVIDRLEKWIVQFCASTGLRQREAWCLHLSDVHVDDDEPHIWVRFGSWDPIKQRYRPPKGRKGERKPRRVPLWGPGLEAAKRWLEARALYVQPSDETIARYAKETHSPLDLMFPTERGHRRDGKPPRSFRKLAKVFPVIPRIGRRIWWHLLRHTCASAMVSGWWGMRWESLQEIGKILGHADVRTTQRYAHLAPSAVAETAARAHDAYVARGHAGVTPRRGSRKPPKKLARHRGFEPLTYGSGGLRNGENDELIRLRDAAVTLIERAWTAVERGDPSSLRQCIAAMSQSHDVLMAIDSPRAAADDDLDEEQSA